MPVANNLPPPCPKGERTPGSGRKPGTPNKVSVAFRVLIGQMVEDPFYQHKLREDFRKRKVHPTVEALVWAYHIGKPKTEIELSGNLELSQRFENDRERLRGLSLEELEALAEESQAVIDRAFDRAMGGAYLQPLPQDVVVEALDSKADAELPAKDRGSDNGSFVNLVPESDTDPASDSSDSG